LTLCRPLDREQFDSKGFSCYLAVTETYFAVLLQSCFTIGPFTTSFADSSLFTNIYKKLIRRWDSERELSLRRHRALVLSNLREYRNNKKYVLYNVYLPNALHVLKTKW